MALKAGRVGVYPQDLDKEGHIKQNSTYELPIAGADTLGGVKPVAKTSGMTQDVGVDSGGKLYTTPSESYTLPVAGADTLGGVKPVAKTSGMTQDVGVDENGKLYVPASVGKIYTKTYNMEEDTTDHFYYTSGISPIAGYTPVSVVIHDVYSGYYVVGNLTVNTNGTFQIMAKPLTAGSQGKSFKAIVYFVKTSDIVNL